MATLTAAGLPVSGGKVQSDAVRKRNAAKALNADKMRKLPLGSQYTIKTLRQASKTIDAAIESVLNGGPVAPELVQSCTQLQMSAASSICG